MQRRIEKANQREYKKLSQRDLQTRKAVQETGIFNQGGLMYDRSNQRKDIAPRTEKEVVRDARAWRED